MIIILNKLSLMFVIVTFIYSIIAILSGNYIETRALLNYLFISISIYLIIGGWKRIEVFIKTKLMMLKLFKIINKYIKINELIEKIDITHDEIKNFKYPKEKKLSKKQINLILSKPENSVTKKEAKFILKQYFIKVLDESLVRYNFLQKLQKKFSLAFIFLILFLINNYINMRSISEKYYSRGSALMRKHMYKKAIHEFQKSIFFNIGFYDAYKKVITCYIKIGDLQRAKVMRFKLHNL